MISRLYFLSASDNNRRSGERWQEAEGVPHEVIKHRSIWMNICALCPALSITARLWQNLDGPQCCDVATAAACPNKRDRKKRTLCSKLLSLLQKYTVSAKLRLNSPAGQYNTCQSHIHKLTHSHPERTQAVLKWPHTIWIPVCEGADLWEAEQRLHTKLLSYTGPPKHDYAAKVFVTSMRWFPHVKMHGWID